MFKKTSIFVVINWRKRIRNSLCIFTFTKNQLPNNAITNTIIDNATICVYRHINYKTWANIQTWTPTENTKHKYFEKKWQNLYTHNRQWMSVVKINDGFVDFTLFIGLLLFRQQFLFILVILMQSIYTSVLLDIFFHPLIRVHSIKQTKTEHSHNAFNSNSFSNLFVFFFFSFFVSRFQWLFLMN